MSTASAKFQARKEEGAGSSPNSLRTPIPDPPIDKTPANDAMQPELSLEDVVEVLEGLMDRRMRSEERLVIARSDRVNK